MADNQDLTPKGIVNNLDKFIVGQKDAKKSVSIALRNRWRRKQLAPELREEVLPKNILMVGPTGVGKTEIARRLAKLVSAPFVKVEATKFTEVGYVGRDVDSIIRDLVDISVKIQREKSEEQMKDLAKMNAEEKVLDILVGAASSKETRNKFAEMLNKGELDDRQIEIEVKEQKNITAPIDISGNGGSMGVINLSDMIGKAMGGAKKKLKKVKVREAIEMLTKEESENLVEEEVLIQDALSSVENDGIVFIDEIDKIVVRGGSGSGSGKEVSREGVQRDLLPLLEGSTVTTKYGTVKTDHILFVCSGAFHLAKPSDLLPELQGRLPIRVELNPLTSEDMLRILKEPFASLPTQYSALLGTEGLSVEFTDDALERIAHIASEINQKVENIGARRLQTIMEKVVEEISFNADSMKGESIKIDAVYVDEAIKSVKLSNADDLSRFIL